MHRPYHWKSLISWPSVHVLETDTYYQFIYLWLERGLCENESVQKVIYTNRSALSLPAALCSLALQQLHVIYAVKKWIIQIYIVSVSNSGWVWVTAERRQYFSSLFNSLQQWFVQHEEKQWSKTTKSHGNLIKCKSDLKGNVQRHSDVSQAQTWKSISWYFPTWEKCYSHSY